MPLQNPAMGGRPACSSCPDDRDRGLSLLRLLIILIGLIGLAWLVKRCRPTREPDDPGTMTVPTWAYRKPDPLLYSQTYLASLGFAVTWDNPDVTVERGGV